MAAMTPQELADRSRFIFRGVVQRLGAATMPSVPVTTRTGVVRVEEVLSAPTELGDWTGQEITTQFLGRQRVREGLEAVFYTNGWLYGEGLAVQSLGHEPIRATRAGLASASRGSASASGDRELRRALAQAEGVVTGVVTSVQAPPEQAVAAAADPTLFQPVSEHDPEWMDAVVRVDSTKRGASEDSVVVRFPSSRDVRWCQVPKYHLGQKGMFLLHRESAPQLRLAGRSGFATAPPVYSALGPHDFVPEQDIERVLTLLDDLPAEG